MGAYQPTGPETANVGAPGRAASSLAVGVVQWRALVVCGIVALGLRLWGIGFGLPNLYHPDEPAYVLQALAVGRGLPNGLTFANPPLYKYLLLGEYAVTYGVGLLSGTYSAPGDVIEQFHADPGLLYEIGRATSAVIGAATVVAAGAVAGAVRGRTAAVFAGCLSSAAFLLVRESHFAVDDALVTLLVTLALAASIRVASGERRWAYLAAGVLVGLAFSAKYTGAIAVVPLVVAHVVRPGRRHSDLALGLGAGLAAAIATFPSLVLETTRVAGDISLHLAQPARTGYDGLDPDGGYRYYLKALGWGLGLPLCAAAGAGLAMALARRDRRLVVVATLPLGLFAGLGSQQLYFARFILPAVPALLVLAAVALDAAGSFAGRLGRRWRLLVLTGGLLAAGIPTLLDTVRFDEVLTRADTRSQAQSWIETNLPNGTGLAVDAPPLGPALRPGRRGVLVADGWDLPDLSLDDYRRSGVVYLVESSFTSEARRVDPVRETRRQDFFGALARGSEVVAQFRPYAGDSPPPFVYDQIYAPFADLTDLERPGPTITIVRLIGSPDRSP